MNNEERKTEPETVIEPETPEESNMPDPENETDYHDLKQSLEYFFNGVLESMMAYREQDVRFGDDLMYVLTDIRDTLTDLYAEISMRNEEMELLAVREMEASEESEAEPETKPETEPETETETDQTETETGITVSSGNLNDIGASLSLLVKQAEKTDKALEKYMNTQRSLLSGIILAVTIGTGFLAGMIALRRFR